MQRKRSANIALLVGAVIVIMAVVLAVAIATRNVGELKGGFANTTNASKSAVEVRNIASPSDYNGNGVDDWADIVAGAREEAKVHPIYDDGYYQGGYPPDDRGACTDLVWRAFRHAGFDLKTMVDADIATHPEHYPNIAKPDPNIDFRRSATLGYFFAAYGQTMPNDFQPSDAASLAQWQPGDILVFDDGAHIGVLSDKRDAQGVPLVIHNNHQKGPFEEDYLSRKSRRQVTGHYRFDASTVDAGVLARWN